MKDLKGKAALVTGGGSGIGRALILEFARRGMKVGVCDVRLEQAQAVAEEARALGAQAHAVACDVSDRTQVVAAVAETAAALGTIQILCANAGVTAFDTMADMKDADLDWIFNVDLMGVSHCVKAVLPGMIAAKDGHIVTTASMAGLVPSWSPIHVPYSAAKAGVIGFSVNLQGELAEHNIGVSTVCPGGVATNITSAPSYRPDRFGGASDEKIRPPAKFVTGNTATFERRKPEQVARMVLDAILHNRLFVMTDHNHRQMYADYSARVMAGFDDAEAFWEKETSTASS